MLARQASSSFFFIHFFVSSKFIIFSSRSFFPSQLNVSWSINVLSVGLDFFFLFKIYLTLILFFSSYLEEQTNTREIKQNIQLFIFTFSFFFFSCSFRFLYLLFLLILSYIRVFSLSQLLRQIKYEEKKSYNISRIIMT